MKERPILFSAEMVLAILDDRKTQTRRVVKLVNEYGLPLHYSRIVDHPCPYGKVGDRLWVRETFQLTEPDGSVGDEWIGDTAIELDGIPKERPESLGYWIYLHYRADNPEMCNWWRPSIFMPRWASRITLEIVGVRVERLQMISRDDAKAEGMSNVWKWDRERNKKHPEHFNRGQYNPYKANYSVLWDEINGKGAWDLNPWVWVIEFKRVEA
jgi:hypothetical protein